MPESFKAQAKSPVVDRDRVLAFLLALSSLVTFALAPVQAQDETFSDGETLVELVRRNVKGQPSHRAAVAVDATASGPRGARQTLQQREGCRASRRVLSEEIMQRTALELSVSRIAVLIKAW